MRREHVFSRQRSLQWWNNMYIYSGSVLMYKFEVHVLFILFYVTLYFFNILFTIVSDYFAFNLKNVTVYYGLHYQMGYYVVK